MELQPTNKGRFIYRQFIDECTVIDETANMDLVVPAVVFVSVGTAGQRCTSTRRLIIHDSVYEEVKNKLTSAYTQLKIGNPLDESNHVGPLIDKLAVDMYLGAIENGYQLLTGVVNPADAGPGADPNLQKPIAETPTILIMKGASTVVGKGGDGGLPDFLTS